MAEDKTDYDCSVLEGAQEIMNFSCEMVFGENFGFGPLYSFEESDS